MVQELVSQTCHLSHQYLPISLPTGTINVSLLYTYLSIRITPWNSMFTIRGSKGILVGHAAVDPGRHDTYYDVAHVHVVLYLPFSPE